MRRAPQGRIVGVDVARGVALLGMMSVHVLPASDADGGASAAFLVSSGRSSALFAVLAGVSLALASGGVSPPVGGALAAARRATAARGAVVAAVGLTLGSVSTGLAIILVLLYAHDGVAGLARKLQHARQNKRDRIDPDQTTHQTKEPVT